MTNDKGAVVHEAGPSVPVEITGLAEVPAAGDVFDVVEDERLAKTLVEQRKHEAKQAKFSEYQKVTLDNLFSQIAEGEMKELAIIVKADVQGSVEAVKQSSKKSRTMKFGFGSSTAALVQSTKAMSCWRMHPMPLSSASMCVRIRWQKKPLPVTMSKSVPIGSSTMPSKTWKLL